MSEVQKFVDAWVDLMVSLPDDYDCFMTCEEANRASELLERYGYPDSAAGLIRAHAAHDEPGDMHYEPVDSGSEHRPDF